MCMCRAGRPAQVRYGAAAGCTPLQQDRLCLLEAQSTLLRQGDEESNEHLKVNDSAAILVCLHSAAEGSPAACKMGCLAVHQTSALLKAAELWDGQVIA